MPRPEPRLTVRAIQPLVSGLRSMGHDPSPILDSIGIDSAILRDPDARVPMSQAWALIARGVETTGDSNLGLHLAENLDPSTLDVHFYAMRSSPTLGAAYQRLSRYQRLIHETTRVLLDIVDDRAILRHRMPGGGAAPRHSAEFIVAAWVRGGRLVTGKDWVPIEVRFAHPTPENAEDHAHYFGAPVHFAMGENALVLPASILTLPCLNSDPSLLALLDRYATDLWRRGPQSSEFADQANSALGELLESGEASAENLASRFKMSVRTLNRTLAAAHTSYRDLLKRLRQDHATRLLLENRVSVAEVAFLTGFSEVSAFHRAFKSWTGQTPAEFRSTHSD